MRVARLVNEALSHGRNASWFTRRPPGQRAGRPRPRRAASSPVGAPGPAAWGRPGPRVKCLAGLRARAQPGLLCAGNENLAFRPFQALSPPTFENVAADKILLPSPSLCHLCLVFKATLPAPRRGEAAVAHSAKKRTVSRRRMPRRLGASDACFSSSGGGGGKSRTAAGIAVFVASGRRARVRQCASSF